MEIITAVIGLVVGAIIAWLVATRRAEAMETRAIVIEEQLGIAQQENAATKAQLANEQRQVIVLVGQLSAAEERCAGLGKKVEESDTRLAAEFERLSLRILHQSADGLKKEHREELDTLLKPFRDQLGDFRQRIDTIHTDESKSVAELHSRIESLTSLNTQVSQQANNLTNALRGQSKMQGDWGEVILDRVLEMSGLRAGHEYEKQASLEGVYGRQLRPDVIIRLPDGNKHLIVDSKVSLTAFANHANATDEVTAGQFLREHVQSIRNHVKQLADKKYQNLSGINSPDFVFLFMPIEPAFLLAMRHDTALYQDALRQRVIVVTPSTLLATLMTVEALWKGARQDSNAQKIASEAGSLYDKFVGFYEDLKQIQTRIKQTEESMDSALGKLRDGNGNLIGKVEKLKKLGAKNTKSIPADALPDTSENEDAD